MADIELIKGADNGNPPDKLPEAYPKVNRNFKRLNDRIEEHIVSTDAHDAQSISYAGDVETAGNVSDAVNDIKRTMDQLIVQGDSGPEAAAARYSPIFAKTFGTLGDRLSYTESILRKKRGDVIGYGADPTGATDCIAAFEAALSENSEVFVPPGKYKVSRTIQINQSNKSLFGAGKSVSEIIASNPDKAVISILTGQENCQILSLTLDRSVVATSGGNGLDCIGVSSSHNFKDLEIKNQHKGLRLGATDYGWFSNSIVRDCYSDALEMFNSTLFSACQWQIEEVLFSFNDGAAMNVHTVVGAAGMSVGKWRQINTFSNGRQGVTIIGTELSPINGLRMSSCFFGADGNSEVFLDSHGGNHQITDCFFEQAGTQKTGRGLSQVPSMVGSGVEITSRNRDTVINSSHFSANAHNGVTSSAEIMCVGCSATENGAGNLQSYRNGFAQYAGEMMLSGCKARYNQFGILAIDGSKMTISGGVFTGNTQSIYYDSNPSSAVVAGNRI